MDADRSDPWTRRRIGLLAGGLGAAAFGLGTTTDLAAKRKKRGKNKNKQKKAPAPLVFAVVYQTELDNIGPGDSFEVRFFAAFHYPAATYTGSAFDKPLELRISAARADLVAGVQESIAEQLTGTGYSVAADRIAVALL